LVYSKNVPYEERTEVREMHDGRKRQPYLKVKAFLVEKEIKHNDLASILDVKRNTVSKKLNGFGADFTLSEVKRLNEKFGIPIAYFFDLDVPIKERKKVC
jgi:transcriptional regulator with XRE-family HTH domain